jgi:hypothetical protein
LPAASLERADVKVLLAEYDVLERFRAHAHPETSDRNPAISGRIS